MTGFPSASGAERRWVQVGTLLDGVSGQPMRNAHVVFDAEAIRYVGAEDQPPPRELLRPGQTAPDFADPAVTLLPGLIEAHAHLFLEGGELDADRRAQHLKRDPAALLADARLRMAKLIPWGVMGVRDAGDRDGVGLALSREGRQGRAAEAPPWPYYESPGAAIHHRGRYGSFMGEALENYPSLRACVEARVTLGADRIKLIPTGIINFQKGAVTTEPQMTTEEVTVLTAAAREFGRQSFAHASGDAGIERAIEGGVDTVEHGFFIREDQLARMRDRDIAWVPTFAPVQAQVVHADRMGWDATVRANLQKILDSHAASLQRGHAMGVKIVAGSDAGSYAVPHAQGFLWELELMEAAGLPALAVINAATGVSSQRLGYRDPIGRIAVGFRSRFIVTRHSPLETVRNLARERTVVFDGRATVVTANDSAAL